ncbi:MAG: FeoB small GTPase domain-containing protein [Chloroflexota bacterium]|nr:FeoB small GTPase domain-containing protein [Chloroflexota bacterium]
MADTVRLALAGNPNTGKSTLFNALTGENQHVGNWPGKTVARRAGWYVHRDRRFEVVDLPGSYSLSAYSPDEEVTRDYIILQRPDLVVNVIDASNLERNLYLTAQLLETGTPLLIALNMHDLALRRGRRVDAHKLSHLLGGTPVVQTAAAHGDGLPELREQIWRMTYDMEPSGILSGLALNEREQALACPLCHRV